MRRYLLDTGTLVAYLRGSPKIVQLVSPWIKAQQAATSMLVYAEVVEHFKSFPEFATRQLQLQRLLRYTYPILERYTDIRRSLRKPHGKGLIGDIDTLIAATALEAIPRATGKIAVVVK